MNYDFFDLMSVQAKENKGKKNSFPVSRKRKPYYMFQLKTQRKPRSVVVPMHSKLYYKKLIPQLLKLNQLKKWKNSLYDSSKNVLGKNKSDPLPNPSKNLNSDLEKYKSVHSSNENFKNSLIETSRNKAKKSMKKNPLIGTKSNSSMSTRKNLFSLLKKKSLKKFYSEFFSASDAVDFDCSGHLNYSNFCKVLSSLQFINDSFNKSKKETELVLRAWKVLGGLEDGKVRVEVLYFFLIRILDKKVEINEKNKEGIKGYQRIKNINVREEFLYFFLNRTQPKPRNQSLAGLDQFEISVPEVVIDKVQDEYSKILEQDEISFTDQCSLLCQPKKILNIGFRNQSETPNLSYRAQNCFSSFCESTGNRSFHESEIENGSPKSEFDSEKSIVSCLGKINSRKTSNEIVGRRYSHRVKGEDKEKPLVNRSFSFKAQGEKISEFHEGSTLTDSKMVRSTNSYTSQLSGQKAGIKVEIINEDG